MFSQAVSLKEQGDMIAAKDVLISLVELDPESTAAVLILGDVYQSLNRREDAIDAFRQAIELSPMLEAASLALFHCLWESGKRDEAMEELKRFQSISDSEEYRKIVSAILSS